METISPIEDLYRYNDWANAKVFGLCEGLTHPQLDEKRELGPGTLRNTLFHILEAEQIWLERWQVAPWRPFQMDSLGMDIDHIEAQLRQVAQARAQLVKSEKGSRWQRVVNYKDSRGNERHETLDAQLLHVANHSVYHRAQALAYLKSFGKTLPVGVDYLLYKLARPNLEQDAQAQAGFKAMGLEVSKAPGWNVAWDAQLYQRYVAYGRWATFQLLELLADADAATLDRDFGMGPGTIRKTLTHLLDAEAKWACILDDRLDAFQPAGQLEIAEITARLEAIFSQSAERVGSLDDAAASRIVTARPGGHPLKLRVSEALLQLCCHGTHHRAQLVNMLRQSGRTVPPSDLIAWWRETTVAATGQ